MDDFNAMAAVWDNEPRRVNLARAVASVIRQHVPISKRMTAFEYGCGTGLLSFNLYPFLKSVKMADISDGMLNVLLEKVKKNELVGIEVEKMDLTENFEPSGSYDLIYTQMTLHHIANVKGLIEVFHKMLTPSGYLCIADLDEEDGSFHAADFQGHNGFNQEHLTRLLCQIGFENIKSDIGFEITKEVCDGVMKTFPVFVISAQKMP